MSFVRSFVVASLSCTQLHHHHQHHSLSLSLSLVTPTKLYPLASPHQNGCRSPSSLDALATHDLVQDRTLLLLNRSPARRRCRPTTVSLIRARVASWSQGCDVRCRHLDGHGVDCEQERSHRVWRVPRADMCAADRVPVRVRREHHDRVSGKCSRTTIEPRSNEHDGIKPFNESNVVVLDVIDTIGQRRGDSNNHSTHSIVADGWSRLGAFRWIVSWCLTTANQREPIMSCRAVPCRGIELQDSHRVYADALDRMRATARAGRPAQWCAHMHRASSSARRQHDTAALDDGH